MLSIKQLHYLFKEKFNKIDSQQNTNFLVPEIDVILREAELIFIKQRVQKSTLTIAGTLDATNKLSDDLISIMKTVTLTPTLSSGVYIVPLPVDYMYYINGTVGITKSSRNTRAKCLFVGESQEIDEFVKSSYEWAEVNLLLRNNQIELTTDDTFTVTDIHLTYVKKPVTFHNAEDHYETVDVLGSEILAYQTTYSRLPKGINNTPSGSSTYGINGYVDIDGSVKFGHIDCELPYHIYNELIDIAVLNTKNSIEEVRQTNNKQKEQRNEQ